MRANRKNSIRTWGARLWTAWDLPGRISRGRAGLARAWQAWRADPRGHLARPFRRLGRALPRLRCREGAVVLVVGGLLVTLSVWAWVQPPKHYSETEERGLAWYLDPKWADLADGSFAGDFAQHTQDQFPLRDSFRTVKGPVSYTHLDVYKRQVLIHGQAPR